MRRGAVCFILLWLFSSCVRIGEPTPDEKSALETWSKVVTDKDRAEVQRAAASHTDWMEKKKVQFMIEQYRTRYNRAQAKKAASQPTTTATTRSSS